MVKKSMEERTKKALSRMALALGTVGTLGLAYVLHKNRRTGSARAPVERWARPGMWVTFRAELMPGRDNEARTFRVQELLASNRVRLEGFAGEYTRDEFERLRLN
jgi:hypothetical protein